MTLIFKLSLSSLNCVNRLKQVSNDNRRGAGLSEVDWLIYWWCKILVRAETSRFSSFTFMFSGHDYVNRKPGRCVVTMETGLSLDSNLDVSVCYNKNPAENIFPLRRSSESRSAQPVRSWSRSCGVWGWWGELRRGWRDSQGMLGHQLEMQETLQCCGEVKQVSENGSGSLRQGRGLLGRWAWLCGVMKTKTMVMMKAMKVFRVSGAPQVKQRMWWGSWCQIWTLTRCTWLSSAWRPPPPQGHQIQVHKRPLNP